PEAIGKALIHHGNARREAVVLNGEAPATQQRDAHRLEVAGRYDVVVDAHPLVGCRCIAGHLDTTLLAAEAHWNHLAQSDRAHARNLTYTLDKPPVELRRPHAIVALQRRIDRRDEQIVSVEALVDGGGRAK